MRLFVAKIFAIALLMMAVGCPTPGALPAPDIPDGIPGAEKPTVDPGGCGGYASTDVGKRIRAFLQATVDLDKAVLDAQSYVRDTCALMGAQLGIEGAQLKAGETKPLCELVATELQTHLQAGVKAEAQLDIQVTPAKCTVDAEVAAAARAECEGSAQTGGEASSSCEGAAGVRASVEAKCEPAVVKVNAGADIALDTEKLERAVKAIEVGVPRLVEIHARLVGPITGGFKVWARAAQDLVAAGNDILTDLGDQVLCVSGQIAAAAEMIAGIEANISVSVEVSVSVSGAAGAAI